MQTNIQERIKIWQGLEGIRKILTEILSHGIEKMQQTSLDQLFPSYQFKLIESRKKLVLDQINQEIQRPELETELREQLITQKAQLEELDDELIIQRNTDQFSYEYILKDIKNKTKQINLAGFVKITSLTDSSHRALVSWQQEKREPVIFLAELLPESESNEKIYFHINLGVEDGLAIIEEQEEKYLWTHIQASDYSELLKACQNDGVGSVSLDKKSQVINLENSNIAAAVALEKAETKAKNGDSIFMNNINLMSLYKKDLQELDFNY